MAPNTTQSQWKIQCSALFLLRIFQAQTTQRDKMSHTFFVLITYSDQHINYCHVDPKYSTLKLEEGEKCNANLKINNPFNATCRTSGETKCFVN